MTLAQITARWLALHAALGVAAPIEDEAHYERLAEFSQQLAERLPDDAHDPLWGLVALIAERIAEYERRVHPWPQIAAHELLAQLMIEHGLAQKDLPEIGPQSLVSAVLSGKRKLNLRQVIALAKRFGVPMETFASWPNFNSSRGGFPKYQ